MYSVSSAYQSAVKEKTRSDSISGSVTLASGEVIAISDDNIVRDSVKITKELCGSSYRIGTFFLSCLQITFIDPDEAVRDYSNARISLTYKLMSGGGQTVPLGIFTADGSAAKRKKNIVTLTAYDNGVKFDAVPGDPVKAMNSTPYGIISAVCGQCGVTFATSQAALSRMPNSNIMFKPSSAQIQSCRDLIMWCADVLCAYAAINRSGALEIIPAKYGVDENDPSEIETDRVIDERERKSISVSDTRSYIKYLTGYSGGKVKNYTSAYSAADGQAFPAAYEMRRNPLLSGKSAEECDAVNTSWLSYIDGFKQRSVTAELYGDPAIDLGDVIRFRGGDIDQRRSIVGLVTGIEWRYRRYTVVSCKAAPCGGGASDAGSRSGVKSQSEKRIDALSSGLVGENIGNCNERFNDYEHNNAAPGGAYHHIVGRNNFAGGGFGSIVGGQNNVMLSSYSLSIGEFLVVQDAADQIVCGHYNAPRGGALFTIGNGTDAEHRSNAAWIDMSGNMEIQNVLNARSANFTGDVLSGGSGSFPKGLYVPLGDGLKLTFAQENGVTKSKITVKAGDGISFTPDEQEPDSGGYLSLKLGDGLQFSPSGSGSGNDVSCAVSLKSASDTQLGGIKLGEGLAYNEATGAVDVTVSGGEGDDEGGGLHIDNAVVIQESDASFILHNYTTVEYIDGNRICYAGPQNQIIVNGYFFYKDTASMTASGSSRYTSALFAKAGTANNNMISNVDFRLDIIRVQSNYTQVVGKSDAFVWTSATRETYDLSRTGIGFVWSQIFPPSEAHPYGYVNGTPYLVYVSNTNTLISAALRTACFFDFASEAEYNAAIGLTYEPNVLALVADEQTTV